MNRQQRRKAKKELRSKGYSSRAIDVALGKNKGTTVVKKPFSVKELEEEGQVNPIHTGDKVRLDVDVIIKQPSYPAMNDAYKNFVESNRNTTFTAKEYVTVDTVFSSNLFLLEEDTKGWLFYKDDLIKVFA